MAAKPVLFDTSAFYALLSRTDRFHPAAREALGRLVDAERELWTTSYILTETMALVERRLTFDTLSRFVVGLGALPTVLWIDREVHTQAWERYAATPDATLGFVDWTTAIAATRLNADVFTFDQGFRAAKIPTLEV